MSTVVIFCAHCQAETEHTAEMNPLNRGELVFTCAACARSIKVDGSLSMAEIKAHLQTHREHNEGQVATVDTSEADAKAMDDLVAYLNA